MSEDNKLNISMSTWKSQQTWKWEIKSLLGTHLKHLYMAWSDRLDDIDVRYLIIYKQQFSGGNKVECGYFMANLELREEYSSNLCIGNLGSIWHLSDYCVLMQTWMIAMLCIWRLATFDFGDPHWPYTIITE